MNSSHPVIPCRAITITAAVFGMALGAPLAVMPMDVDVPPRLERRDVAAERPNIVHHTNKDSSALDDQEPPTSGIGVYSFDFEDSRACPGYNLISPVDSTRTYLFDMQGRVVHAWESDCSPALSAYLLDNGHLLRAGAIGPETNVFGPAPGVGGRIQEFTWDGGIVWDFRLCNARQIQHHDVIPLANGNVLAVVWERKTAREAVAAGRRPDLIGDDYLLVDALLEIKPTAKTGGEVVWEWHLWDHLVQDFDCDKPHYGNVAQHAELVDLNYIDPEAPLADWTHFNSVAYNAALDQIMVSVRHFSEFWIIDHSTTTAEATGHKGGRRGKGGDLLYRWGNARAYRAGKKDDQKLFVQHNAHWIGDGLPGAGHVLVFNNGTHRPDGDYSSVDEVVLPVNSQGRYAHKPGNAYGPERAAWSYRATRKEDFYSHFVSGAQRLPNGNTLICSGAEGVVFEVTTDKHRVWEYENPSRGEPGPVVGFGPPPEPGQLFTPIVRELLSITAPQAARLDGLQKEVDVQLARLLTVEQRNRLEHPGADEHGHQIYYEAGQALTAAQQPRLELSDDQRKELELIQKEIDRALEKILSQDQQRQVTNRLLVFKRGGPANARSSVPIFRVHRYAASHPGLADKSLTAGPAIEEIEAQ